MHRPLVCMTVLGCVLAATAARGDEPPPDSPKPSAAELIAKIIKDENKVHELRSLYLRFEDKTTISPERIARNLAELKKRRAGAKIDPKRETSLWGELTSEIELAFDEKRVRHVHHLHGANRTLTTWDGRVAVLHQEFFLAPGAERYTLDRSPTNLFSDLFGFLSWPRVAAHKFWYTSDASIAPQHAKAYELPANYTAAGETDFRGHQCYVLENREVGRRLFVGVEDRRLHGMRNLRVFPAGILELASRTAGRQFKDLAEVDRWFKDMADEDKQRYAKSWEAEKFSIMRPWYEYVLDDYRELAPGFWVPATQETAELEPDGEASRDLSRSKLRLVESKVNEPLADELFTVELTDGAEVFDRAYDPPLYYTQKADRTPKEWQQVMAEYRKNSAEFKQTEAARDALVGQPAPEFPKSTWLNSPPLDLAALKGKVVVLEFWSIGCAPCRGSVQHAQRMHAGGDGRLVVIGVHTPGADAKEIEQFAKKAELTFPILIDLPRPPENIWGLLAGQLEVNAIPHAFVIDPQGRLAAHGALHEVGAKIRELLRKEQ